MWPWFKSLQFPLEHLCWFNTIMENSSAWHLCPFAPGSSRAGAEIFLWKHLLGSHTPAFWWPHSWLSRRPRRMLTVHKSNPFTIPRLTRWIRSLLFRFLSTHSFWQWKTLMFSEILENLDCMLLAAVFYSCNGCVGLISKCWEMYCHPNIQLGLWRDVVN